MDRRSAERMKAMDEGREPPAEPTAAEVRGAMIAAEAMGKPLTEAEAVALLRRTGGAKPPDRRSPEPQPSPLRAE